MLIFTHKISPRFTYITKHICTRMLGIPVLFTSKLEEFINHEGPKLSYTNKPLGNELYLKSADLLFEQGVETIEFTVQDWDGVPCFFGTSDESFLPFDVFAASFYLLSRYEEYLPHVKDELGRYPMTESLAHTNHFLMQPVVDIWVARFKDALLLKFPELEIREKEFVAKAVIEVAQAFAYTKIGLLRNLGGFFRDFFKFRLKRNIERTQVLFNLRKDPFDTFTWLINVQKQTKNSFLYFFQLGDYALGSKNIKHTRASFRSLMKMVNDYSDVGLLISEAALSNGMQLKVEKERMEAITHRPLLQSKTASHRMSLPETYRNLLEKGILEDYSLSYGRNAGFRAGTCTPFLFYDLDYEIQTPLTLFTPCLHINTIVNQVAHTVDQVLLRQLITTVGAVDGHFLMEFSNTSFIQAQTRNLFKELFIYD